MGKVRTKKEHKKRVAKRNNVMQQDKKNDNGEVRICLLTRIGSCIFDQKLTFENFNQVISGYIS